jgi:hypothetical protein
MVQTQTLASFAVKTVYLHTTTVHGLRREERMTELEEQGFLTINSIGECFCSEQSGISGQCGNNSTHHALALRPPRTGPCCAVSIAAADILFDLLLLL